MIEIMSKRDSLPQNKNSVIINSSKFSFIHKSFFINTNKHVFIHNVKHTFDGTH